MEELLLQATPEYWEKQRLIYEKLEKEKLQKVKEAVKDENIFVTEDKWHNNKKTTLFLETKKKLEGESARIGQLEFTIHEKVNLKDVYVLAKFFKRDINNRKIDKLIHVNLVHIDDDYRGYHLSEKLIERFVEIYERRYADYSLSMEFKTPVAEYLFHKILKKKGRTDLLKTEFIQRYYVVSKEHNADDVTLINELKKKDTEVFPLHTEEYICELPKKLPLR